MDGNVWTFWDSYRILDRDYALRKVKIIFAPYKQCREAMIKLDQITDGVTYGRKFFIEIIHEIANCFFSRNVDVQRRTLRTIDFKLNDALIECRHGKSLFKHVLNYLRSIVYLKYFASSRFTHHRRKWEFFEGIARLIMDNPEEIQNGDFGNEAGVYMMFGRDTEHIYIGSTVRRFYRRWAEHHKQIFNMKSKTPCYRMMRRSYPERYVFIPLFSVRTSFLRFCAK